MPDPRDGANAQPAPAAVALGDGKPKPISDERIREIAQEALDRRVTVYRDRAKWFGIGFGCLLGLGFLGGKDLVQGLHAKAFPPDSHDKVEISYEGYLLLGDGQPRSATASLSFYAEEGQTVQVYARINRRFVGLEERLVSVTVDGSRFQEPVMHIEGAFHDITEHLNWGTDLTRQRNVHQVGFELSDTQALDEDQEVNVLVIVIVRGTPNA